MFWLKLESLVEVIGQQQTVNRVKLFDDLYANVVRKERVLSVSLVQLYSVKMFIKVKYKTKLLIAKGLSYQFS